MSIQPSDYEQLLSKYSDCNEAIILLKQYRPYLEMIPSIRRSEESLITIPLPVVKLRKVSVGQQFNEFSPITSTAKTILIPCDLAYLMCDPEWKIKMGGEIVIFIQRPEEDLSDFQSLSRGITLVENRETKQVTAHTFSFEQLEHAINVGNEIRA